MTIDDLLSRRSVRKYTAESVTSEQLNAALRVAMAAPSAMRCDPWRFIVLTERADIDALAELLPYGKMLHNAPAAFIVCGDLTVAHRGELSYLLQDVSASIENLLLALHAQGLGAVWLGIHPNEDRIQGVTERFGLPPGILPISAISVGHPAETPPPQTRYDASKVHFGRW